MKEVQREGYSRNLMPGVGSIENLQHTLILSFLDAGNNRGELNKGIRITNGQEDHTSMRCHKVSRIQVAKKYTNISWNEKRQGSWSLGTRIDIGFMNTQQQQTQAKAAHKR